METIRFEIGDKCLLNGKEYFIEKFVTTEKAILRCLETNEIELAFLRNLSKAENCKEFSGKILELISDKDWLIAQKRFAIILEINQLLENDNDLLIADSINKVASKHNVSARSIYRWRKRFDQTPLISSLVPITKSGGKGKGRISIAQERLIKEVINEFHYSAERPKVKKSYRELQIRCYNQQISVPSHNTFRSRIIRESLSNGLKKRYSRTISDQLTEPRPGSYPKVKSPYEVIQIDHTPLDVIVVNENRKPIGRPWLTLAIDVYSSMVAGFYISFDSPGFLGTGICIANAMLPKDDIISKYKLKSEWPAQGLIQNIHTDNAPEFKSKSLLMACQEYGINLNYRGKGKTHWGGHIERLLGNFLSELHLLPGTTFSNVAKKRDYDSEKKATLTLHELESWLHIFIVDIYHNTIHSGHSMSPLKKFYEGINSFDSELPSGMGTFNFDATKLKIDFLPMEERTIQRTGVQIDHIRYYGDVLRPYLDSYQIDNSLNPTKRRAPVKLIFKRDPRDLSRIFFLDPKLKRYFPIYYANTSHPSISIWEHRAALNELRKKGKIDNITENIIFNAHNQLNNIVSNALSEKKKSARAESKKKSKEYIPKDENPTVQSSFNKIEEQELDFDNIQLFSFDDNI